MPGAPEAAVTTAANLGTKAAGCGIGGPQKQLCCTPRMRKARTTWLLFGAALLTAAITGLGAMLSLYGNIFETAKMFVVIIVLAVLGVGLIRATQWLERRLATWKETERAVN